MVDYAPPRAPLTGDQLARAAVGAAEQRRRTGHAGMGGRRVKPQIEFGKAAGDTVGGRGAAAPASTATTVRVRNGEVTLTDGPYIEGAEVANGFYFINTTDRDEAVKIASMIPATTVSNCAG